MEQESAFNELKHRLTIAPVSAYPNFSPDAGLFVLDTDASQPLGIGAVLSRLQRNDTERDSIRDASSGKQCGPFSLLLGGTKNCA